MKATTIIEIVVVIILTMAFIIFLIRRNMKDIEDTNPELTEALKKKKQKR